MWWNYLALPVSLYVVGKVQRARYERRLRIAVAAGLPAWGRASMRVGGESDARRRRWRHGMLTVEAVGWKFTPNFGGVSVRLPAPTVVSERPYSLRDILHTTEGDRLFGVRTQDGAEYELAVYDSLAIVMGAGPKPASGRASRRSRS